MFNFFKLLFVINFIKSNVKQFVILALLMFLLFTAPYVFDDILTLVPVGDRLVWVLTKWALLVFIISSICRVVYKIAVKPIKNTYLLVEKREVLQHKHPLLTKKYLLSKGERIKNKYRKPN